jgi:CO/xanthine dehydrogenase Mo-binding subunit
MGQGAVLGYTHLVADGLGLPAERVTIRMADTELVPFDTLTASSRSLVHVGNALLAAVADIRRQVAELAAQIWGLGPDDVRIKGAVVTAGAWTGTLADVVCRAFGVRPDEVVGVGTFRSPSDADHPLGGPTPFFEAVATGVDLSVDAETGLVDVHRVVHVTDAGRVLDRQRATGLDEGGVVMGLGLALSEALVYTPDGLVNGSSLDYRIPTAADSPTEAISMFQENGDGPGPFGSKGLAEGGILAVAPAVAAALHAATGRRFRDLPVTPETVWRACREGA